MFMQYTNSFIFYIYIKTIEKNLRHSYLTFKYTMYSIKQVLFSKTDINDKHENISLRKWDTISITYIYKFFDVNISATVLQE